MSGAITHVLLAIGGASVYEKERTIMPRAAMVVGLLAAMLCGARAFGGFELKTAPPRATSSSSSSAWARSKPRSPLPAGKLYFAIKTRDEENNQSPISNVVEAEVAGQ